MKGCLVVLGLFLLGLMICSGQLCNGPQSPRDNSKRTDDPGEFQTFGTPTDPSFFDTVVTVSGGDTTVQIFDRSVVPHASSRDIGAALKDVMVILNRTNDAGGSDLFDSVEIKEHGARLEVIVSDEWYGTPFYQKERLVEALADQYANIACERQIRTKCDETDYPTTSFVDVAGKEVAYRSTWRGTKILR